MRSRACLVALTLLTPLDSHSDQAKKTEIPMVLFPALSIPISLEQKKAMLQELLEEYCLLRQINAISGILKNAREKGLSLSPLKPLENAIRRGFEDVISELCIEMDLSQLSEVEKKSLVAISVEMGYPELLPLLQKLGFPVAREHQLKMEELIVVQNILSPCISFPEPINTSHDLLHGGDDNRSIAAREYKLMVGYAFNYIRTGGSFRTLLDNLIHRRIHMAVLCKLILIEEYGTPTNRAMTTWYHPIYNAYGERIKEKYRLPVKVEVSIQGKKIPLTVLTTRAWFHPDGTHREEVLQEVAHICESNFRTICGEDEFAGPLSRVIFLLSHQPPSLRGTPIVMRTLVDAICLSQLRDPIDPRRDLNCEALTFVDIEKEFPDFFASTTSLPIRISEEVLPLLY